MLMVWMFYELHHALESSQLFSRLRVLLSLEYGLIFISRSSGI